MFVAYLRVSTENQRQEGTISLQKREMKDYCVKNGINIDKYFADEGVSGAIEDRPGLATLFDFIETNAVHSLIIFKLDRLSRDLRKAPTAKPGMRGSPTLILPAVLCLKSRRMTRFF